MEQGNELGIDLMAPAYNFMLFKIFSKNENDTEADTTFVPKKMRS